MKKKEKSILYITPVPLSGRLFVLFIFMALLYR